MWTIFKVFVQFATILLPLFFFFAFLAVRHVEFYFPNRDRTHFIPPLLEGEVLTTGPLGKSLTPC